MSNSWGLLDDFLGAVNLIDLTGGLLAGLSYGDVGGHRIAVSTTADSSHSLNEVRAIKIGRQDGQSTPYAGPVFP